MSHDEIPLTVLIDEMTQLIEWCEMNYRVSLANFPQGSRARQRARYQAILHRLQQQESENATPAPPLPLEVLIAFVQEILDADYVEVDGEQFPRGGLAAFQAILARLKGESE